MADGSNSEPVGMEFDFSLASLNQRLRALQLRRENEEGGSGSSSGGGSGSRHRGHSHSGRSRSRNHYGSALPAGSLFFMRPERSKLVVLVCWLELAIVPSPLSAQLKAAFPTLCVYTISLGTYLCIQMFSFLKPTIHHHCFCLSSGLTFRHQASW